jgi:hypothetical protein
MRVASKTDETSYHRVAWSTKLGNKECNSPIYVMIFSANAGVPHQKMADHVKNRDGSAKGIMCQKLSGTAVMICTLRLRWSNMKNKQTSMKQQQITVSPGANVWNWKQQRQEIMPRIICCHKHQAMKRCDGYVDRVGRQHVTTIIFDTESKKLCLSHSCLWDW